MTTFYRKEGRKYIPVKEYDDQLLDSYQRGTHIVVSEPGHKITRYNIEPQFAPLIAAGHYATDSISAVLVEASSLRHRELKTPLTPGQKKAWENLVKEFGDSAKQLEWPSAREAAEAGVNALIEEAHKRLQHPEVKKAFEHFLLVASLVK